MTDPDASPVREARDRSPKLPRWSAERRASLAQGTQGASQAPGVSEHAERVPRKHPTFFRRSAHPSFRVREATGKPRAQKTRRGNEKPSPRFWWADLPAEAAAKAGERRGVDMSEAKKRTRAKDEPAQDARLTAILRDAHARLRLWGKCKDSACSRTETCGGDAAQCGARLAPESWAWLTQVVQAVLRGQPQAAAIEAANIARLPYRARRTVRWPGVPCWEPIEFLELHDGTWVRVDQVPAPAAIDPHVVALAASDWLARALRADRRGKDAVRDDGKERKALV